MITRILHLLARSLGQPRMPRDLAREQDATTRREALR